MDESKQGNFEFSLEWQSQQAVHTERVYISRVNFWRDYFPGRLGDKIADINQGDTVSELCDAGIVVEPFQKDRIYKFSKRKFNLEKLAADGFHFQVGRYYPRSALASVGFTSSDMRPFRVLENAAEHLVVDINHPLSTLPLTVSATMLKALPSRFERGGSSNDIGLCLADDGPGLQMEMTGSETDFFSRQPFARQDERPDSAFYGTPRLVDHIDKVAREHISALYGRFMHPGMKILDLMSGWNSHLPEIADGISVTGLGLNEKELVQNSRLTERVVHDLNDSPILPFSENEFDLVVCTVSIEYLIDPVAVFKETSRVLKPGAPFIVTFSDRWFPPKVIKLWTELHPFERLALVLSYFRNAEGFEEMQTETVRGYPRLPTDQYFRQRSDADPLFAAWSFAT